MHVSGHLSYLQSIINNGGPNPSDYETVLKTTSALMDVSIEDKASLFDILKPIINVNSMIGHSFLKPYGYAGDFELIYRIYAKLKDGYIEFEKWDEFYHSTALVKAIRKRKSYFINQITKTSSKKQSPLVLNLGSGPCVDVVEFYKKSPRSSVKFECLDMDDKSIQFASVVCDNFIDSMSFTNENVFNYKSEKQFDLIWAAGLFDYFNDKLFISLLKKYYKLLKIDGKLIIANFDENNPSRGFIEVICQWEFQHRSKDKLIDLAINAGIPEEKIEVKSVDTGINLFLHLSK